MYYKNLPLMLVTGLSGIGKSSVIDCLVKSYTNEIFKSVKSYTTRPKRDPNEQTHIFISEKEFDHLNLIASTTINGYHYGATKEEVDNSNIYIIDPKGISSLIENNYQQERDLFIVHLGTGQSFLYMGKKILLKRLFTGKTTYQEAKERVDRDLEVFHDYLQEVYSSKVNGKQSFCDIPFSYIDTIFSHDNPIQVTTLTKTISEAYRSMYQGCCTRTMNKMKI